MPQRDMMMMDFQSALSMCCAGAAGEMSQNKAAAPHKRNAAILTPLMSPPSIAHFHKGLMSPKQRKAAKVIKWARMC